MLTDLKNEKTYASFGERALAFIIDIAILAALGYPVSFLFSMNLNVNVDVNNPQQAMQLLLASFANLTVQNIIWLVYYCWFYKNKGATPGKLLMQLRVLDIETEEFLSYKQTLMREFVGKLVSAFTLGYGYLMVIFREDKRALHDLIGKTIVIKNPVG